MSDIWSFNKVDFNIVQIIMNVFYFKLNRFLFKKFSLQSVYSSFLQN